MPSTYSSRLRLELQADGENAGLWGQFTNRNLGTLIETAIAGYRTIALLDANYTLTASNGLDDEARYAMLNFTGALTATRDVVVPSVSKLYVVKNQTNQTLNVKTSGGAARAVPAGKTVYLFVDGTDTFDSLNDLTSLRVSGATTLAATSATDLSYTGTLTGGTGVINIGSGQIVKRANGAVGIGVNSDDTVKLYVTGTDNTSSNLALLVARADGQQIASFRNDHRVSFGNGSFILDPAGNAGLGVTTSAWVGFKALDVNTFGALASATNRLSLAANNYFDGTNFRYKLTDFASRIDQINGQVQFFTAPSGTAGNPITFTQAMTLTQGGNLLVGTTTDNGQRLRLESTSKQLGLTYPSVATWNFSALSGGAFAIDKDGSEYARINSIGFAKFSNNGVYGNVAGIGDQTTSASHIVQSNDAINTFSVINGNTGGAVRGVTTALATGAAGLHYDALLNAVTVYRVLANGNIENANNSYGAISDAKLKNIIAARDGKHYWEKFKQIKFWVYSLISDPTNQQLLGVIAQELQAIFPGIVNSTPDMRTVTKTRNVTKEVAVTAPEMQDQTETVLEQINGKWVEQIITRQVEVQVPVFDEYLIYDIEGNVTGRTHKVPRMQTVDEIEEYQETEPTGEVTLSVNYSVLGLIADTITQELIFRVEAQQSQIESILPRLIALEQE